MSEFLYLFRGGESGRNASPEAMQQVMQKWVKWVERLNTEGKLANGGHPLQGAGKVVAGPAQTITDGPFAEGKEIVGGYILVKAASLDEAATTAKGCPIFEFGGTVEVREVAKM